MRHSSIKVEKPFTNHRLPDHVVKGFHLPPQYFEPKTLKSLANKT